MLNPLIVPTRPTIITMTNIIRDVNLFLFINVEFHRAYRIQGLAHFSFAHFCLYLLTDDLVNGIRGTAIAISISAVN